MIGLGSDKNEENKKSDITGCLLKQNIKLSNVRDTCMMYKVNSAYPAQTCVSFYFSVRFQICHKTQHNWQLCNCVIIFTIIVIITNHLHRHHHYLHCWNVTVGAFSAEGGKWGFRSGLSYLLIWMGTMMIGTKDDDYHEGGDDGDFGDDDFKGEPSNLICGKSWDFVPIGRIGFWGVGTVGPNMGTP